MKVIHSYSTHIQIDMYTVGVHVHKKVYGNIKACCCEINETRLKIQRFVSYTLCCRNTLRQLCVGCNNVQYFIHTYQL